MTGRELIIYILENNLENKPVFENGRLLGFMTVEEAAYVYSVGPATVKMWAEHGQLESIKLSDVYYIPRNASKPVPT